MTTITDARDPDEYMREFFAKVAELTREETDWRLGQIYFTALNNLDPIWATDLIGSVADPYNDDLKIRDMIAWLEDRLTRP